MGYGHQRAAYALRHLAYGEVISANSYDGIPSNDRRIWRQSRSFYEFISRFKNVPIIGPEVFDLYDYLQSIPSFYPRRDLSRPTFQVKEIMSLIRKSDWGQHLIAKLAKRPMPMICTFFVPAFMAEYFKYPGDIYCLVTDADISRAWVTQYPARSRIRYLAPTYRAADRLKLYGIRPENIYLTGFPLPIENLGNERLAALKTDLLQRLTNLDSDGRYRRLYRETIRRHLGHGSWPRRSNHPLTLTFAVGGAGAQRDLAVVILNSLKDKIRQHRIRYNMIAGIHNDLSKYFRSAVRQCGLHHEVGHYVNILFAKSKEEYFGKFNVLLRTTDILWSKPSELCFYTALGLPLVIAPPIGSQEHFNQRWVESVGSGTSQDDPEYTHEWLFDWLKSGWLAEAALEGFIEAPKLGIFNIEKLITNKSAKAQEFDLVLQY